ncbi:autophagy-related protein 13-domain-containing protein [Paraphysoderma sedebokerense]|nr:autophagy-related protein 13-domain-containing protein [Paraphysoderma sedebokerense]
MIPFDAIPFAASQPQSIAKSQSLSQKRVLGSKDAKTNSLISQFYSKVAQVVVQSRLTNIDERIVGGQIGLAIEKVKTANVKVNKWFAIDTPDLEFLKEETKFWRSFFTSSSSAISSLSSSSYSSSPVGSSTQPSNTSSQSTHLTSPEPPMMVIEIFLDLSNVPLNHVLLLKYQDDFSSMEDNDQGGIKIDLVREGLRNGVKSKERISSILLERWVVNLTDTNHTPSPVPDIPTTYKKSISFFRALFSYLRLIPSYGLVRDIRSGSTELMNAKVGYRLSTEIGIERRGECSFAPKFNHHQSQVNDTLARYQFAKIPTLNGNLNVSVEYRSQAAYRLYPAETVLSEEFVNSSIPSPYKNISIQPFESNMATNILSKSPADSLDRTHPSVPLSPPIPIAHSHAASSSHKLYSEHSHPTIYGSSPPTSALPSYTLPTSSFSRTTPVTGHPFKSQSTGRQLYNQTDSKTFVTSDNDKADIHDFLQTLESSFDSNSGSQIWNKAGDRSSKNSERRKDQVRNRDKLLSNYKQYQNKITLLSESILSLSSVIPSSLHFPSSTPTNTDHTRASPSTSSQPQSSFITSQSNTTPFLPTSFKPHNDGFSRNSIPGTADTQIQRNQQSNLNTTSRPSSNESSCSLNSNEVDADLLSSVDAETNTGNNTESSNRNRHRDTVEGSGKSGNETESESENEMLFGMSGIV